MVHSNVDTMTTSGSLTVTTKLFQTSEIKREYWIQETTQPFCTLNVMFDNVHSTQSKFLRCYLEFLKQELDQEKRKNSEMIEQMRTKTLQQMNESDKLRKCERELHEKERHAEQLVSDKMACLFIIAFGCAVNHT